MTNHQLTNTGASAPALLVALAIAPILFSSCGGLSKEDREVVEIPPAPIASPVSPAEQSSDAAPTEPVAPPYSLDGAVKYVVQSGDTLSGIADAHGVSIRDVKAANKISDANKIRAGQTLLLPGEATEGDSTPDETEQGSVPEASPGEGGAPSDGSLSLPTDE